MAYAALVSLSHTIEQFLNHDKYPISLHQKQKIISIHEYVIFLQVFLEDVPQKVNSTLEGRIRDVANQAEDVIEYFTWRQIQSHYPLIKSNITKRNKVRFQDHPNRNLYYDYSELDEVAEETDSIAVEVMSIMNQSRFKEMKLGDSGVASSSSASSSSRIAPTNKKDAMVGFDGDLLTIKGWLCGEPSKLEVISIAGIGGIGKTTLARNAYNDPLTMQYFDIRAWVTISQDYSAERVFPELLNSMKEFNTGRSDVRHDEKVYQTLKGRRYLIVMDDIWSIHAWDDVTMMFPDDNNGSRIMLTTRVIHVADYVGFSSRVYVMKLMNPHQSWNLLRNKVFKDENCPVELENIGKEIARICGGLPLAIVVIAGLVSTVSTTRASWDEIAEYLKSNVAADGQIGKVLSVSYRHLPHHLKPCFLYMAAFPEDYEIRVNELIKLWVAEGFLRSSGSKSFEEEAEGYLEDLVKRNLFSATKRNSNGKIKSCSIHDMVRDLCIRKAKEEKFFHLIDSYAGQILPESAGYKRRVAIAHSDLNCISRIHGSSIRTIICCKHKSNYRGEYFVFGRINFRLLRILHIVDAPISDLPTTLFELFHLRYLGFCYTSTSSKLFFRFPARISNLQNLQTIIIHVAKIERDYGNYLVYLPLEIWRMPKLRHLVCFLFNCLPDLPGPSFLLENLQTLSRVSNFLCTKQILKMIPNLKKLGLSYSKHGGYRDYLLDNLVYLQRLEKLKMEVSADFPFQAMVRPVFPETLKKLTLSGLELPWEDMITMIGSLRNLEVLKLRDFACKGERWETSEGEFSELKYLLIDHSNLHEWITERSHFPRLKCLLLHHCPELIEIPDGIGEIPTLELIEIKGTNKSLVESAKRIREEQQDCDNDVLQVRFVT